MFDRSKVLWVGASPADQHRTEHINRGLALCEIDLARAQPETLDLVHARGFVLCAMPPMVPAVIQVLGCVVDAVNHGLHVMVLLADPLALEFVQRSLEKLLPKGPVRDHVRYRIGATAHEIAEVFARHDPGPSVNRALKFIKPPGFELTEQQEFLLQRAFGDCSSVELMPLPGGRSAATLLVQATLANSMAGPHPLPFFAKLDRAVQIVTERDCYARFAESHIAWNLRPNLQPGRCLIGSNLGILVGSFVTRSESLWSLILQGRASGAIKALFEETLAGWRASAAAVQSETGSIAPALANVFSYENVRSRYVKSAASLGYAQKPLSVWEGFLNLPTRTWPKAPIHGDLHADNVRVRGEDAIIIDLARVTMGPPSADPACMEVWIAFQMPPPQVAIDQDVWLRTVRELFAVQNVLVPPVLDGATTLAWMRDAVLHTRAVALASSPPVDYAITLALFLLRRAMFDPDPEAQEVDMFRRTWAWILGCQLLKGVQQLECSYQEAA
ncbi:MAG: phosphotransferase [Ramlibacter sp.]